MEKWKTIESNPNYQISNFGRVKNNKGFIMKSTPHIRSSRKTDTVYQRIELKNPRKKYLVHRLVAEAFVSGDKTLIVNHIDENGSNNHYENLEFVTNRYNCEYSQGKTVYQYDTDMNLLETHKSVTRAAEKTGSHLTLISHVCLGKRKTHNGYIWKYE